MCIYLHMLYIYILYLSRMHAGLMALCSRHLSCTAGCGPEIALRQLWGWHPSMEYPDLLHTLWIGTVRDCVGSMLMDLAEHSSLVAELETWDERLQASCKVRSMCPQVLLQCVMLFGIFWKHINVVYVQVLALDARSWCQRHGLSPSLVDDWSFLFAQCADI